MNTDRIVKEIKQGNLVITPTDTVYGILADATNPTAIEKVYLAKQRDHRKPLIMLVADEKMLREYVVELNDLETKLVHDFLPGKMTILLRRNEKVLGSVVNGGELIGIRIPDQPELIEIIRSVGNPLVSTSANLSEHVTVTNPDLLEPKVLEKISYVENAGTVESAPSTLVKVDDGKVEILRDGELAGEVKKRYLS